MCVGVCVCVVGGGGGGVGGWGGGCARIVYSLSSRTSCPSRPYVRKMVSVRYLLRRLMYWIHILYTHTVYNHKIKVDLG